MTITGWITIPIALGCGIYAGTTLRHLRELSKRLKKLLDEIDKVR